MNDEAVEKYYTKGKKIFYFKVTALYSILFIIPCLFFIFSYPYPSLDDVLGFMASLALIAIILIPAVCVVTWDRIEKRYKELLILKEHATEKKENNKL